MNNNQAKIPRNPSTLRFSPTAWAKLLFLRDLGETEIGGFGISANDDLLLIEDVVLVAQTCTWVHVEFDDSAVAEYFERHVEAGRRPENFARIWIHTHPGRSAEPSSTDEATFRRVFERSDWALMFILARGGQTYARLRYNIGPGVDIKLPIEIEYGCTFGGSDVRRWQAEFDLNVRTLEPVDSPAIERPSRLFATSGVDRDHGWCEDWDEFAEFDRHLENSEYGSIRDY
jgi:hypothetical protein